MPTIEDAEVVSAVTIAPAVSPAPAQTDLAVAQTSSAMTAQVSQGADGFPEGSLAEIASALGFEGLSFDAYGIIPSVSLTQGVFKVSDGTSLGTEFLARITSHRVKYLYKYKHLPAGKPAVEENFVEELAYTYDQTTIAGTDRTIAEFVATATQLGAQPKISKYYEMMAHLQDGRLVDLNVPEAGSGSAVARWMVTCISARRRPDSVWTRVYKGEEVTSTKYPFFPWALEPQLN